MRFPTHKNFFMGNEQHYSSEATEICFQNKKHIFHIVSDNFPLPEDGFTGLPFLRAYSFQISNNYIQLDDCKYDLHSEKIFIPANSVRFVTFDHPRKNGHCMIVDHPNIDDAIFRISEGQVRVLIVNNTYEPMLINQNSIKTVPIKVENQEPPETEYVTSAEIGKRIKLRQDHLKLSHIEESYKTPLERIIYSYNDIFTLPGDPLPYTNVTTHKIEVKNEKPINIRSYRPPECHKQEVRRQISEMLKDKVIKESNSPWNSPIWVVGKNSGKDAPKKWRVVIDFRKLNERTDQDAYPLPVIEDILNQLGNAKFFSAFDLSWGFWQIKLHPDSTKYTAFSTPDGHFEFLRMPFGLKNGPPTFQRMMDTAFRGLIGKICFVYMDDIVVFGSTIEEHNQNCAILFERLRAVGLKLKPEKCKFLRPELEYLGHVISSEGVSPNPEKLSAVQDFRRPSNVKEVQSFLGLCGYYRKFIKNFATVAHPLYRLTRKNVPFIWSDICEEAFQALKRYMCSPPVLKQPNLEKTFILTTDASNVGLGAILSQEGHPCCYIFRRLNKHEVYYSTSEKEMLAVVWSVKRLRQYLLGRKFIIQSDHQALKYLISVKDPSSRLLKWRLRLEGYEYQIEYKKGCENQAADALSRIFMVTNKGDPDLEAINELANALPDIPVTNNDLNTPPSSPVPITNDLPEPIESLDLDILEENNDVTSSKLYDEFCTWLEHPTDNRSVYSANANSKLWVQVIKNPARQTPDCILLPPFHEKEWLEILGRHIEDVINKKYTRVRLHLSDPCITAIEKLNLKKLILFFEAKYDQISFMICLTPSSTLTDLEIGEIIRESHGLTATQHFGEFKTIQRARERGLWSNMEKEISEYVKRCPTCQIHKKNRIRAMEEAIITDTPTEPIEKIAMDIYGLLQETSEGHRFILSIQDTLTKFLTLIPLKNHTSESIIDSLFDQYIYIFSSPKHILTDQGADFVSELIQSFENFFQIHHVKTTAFHPESNGSLERAHSVVGDLIRTSVNDNNVEWHKVLKIIATAYNTAVHEGTGFSPFQLMFGRKANLPSALATTPSLKYTELVKLWKNRHEKYLEKAKQIIEKRKEKHKEIFDSRIVKLKKVFNIGDTVLLLNNNKKHKLEQPWIGPYQIQGIHENNNYTIQIDNKPYKTHANRLKPYQNEFSDLFGPKMA